jgi:hypothetical protein
LIDRFDRQDILHGVKLEQIEVFVDGRIEECLELMSSRLNFQLGEVGGMVFVCEAECGGRDGEEESFD